MKVKSFELSQFEHVSTNVSDKVKGFSGYVSTFTNKPDCYGDIVHKDAFTKTLDKWEKSGLKVPLLWNHDVTNPFFNIGHISWFEVDSHGVKVYAEFDMSNPTARYVAKLTQEGRVREMSFAYNTLKASPSGYGGEYLEEIELLECSLVLVGANREAVVLEPSKSSDSVECHNCKLNADEAPADEAPADEAPADEAPADEAPADEAPAENQAETSSSDELHNAKMRAHINFLTFKHNN